MLGARTVWRAVVVVGLAGALMGCSPSAGDRGRGVDDLPRVVATTSLIADLARQLGGQRVAVTGLMGPGVDPHLYRASARDLQAMAEADLILYHGLHLEGRMAEVFEQVGRRGIPTRAVTTAIPAGQLLSPPGAQGMPDPHVWFDVRLWMLTVPTVRDALGSIDPGGKAEFASRAEAYLAELAKLDDYVAAQAGRVPAPQRVLVTAHDAFNYFGQRYGFEVRGLQGISTAAEAGTRDVQELAAFIATRRLPAIFVESSVAPRTIEAVQAAVRGRGAQVRIGGQLYSDALGDPGTPAGTYLGMVRANIETIVEGLAAQ
ncbi:MAG: zinc ABC transporter substrate-binding protein [Armatimonadetes bacterium]|nr:zinc ABC transporter substrate-binding protein [Armatimonadota bacterium]